MHISDKLPGLWKAFIWYAPFCPVIYLFFPLIEANANHMIWISLICVFFSLFAHVIHQLLYDIPLSILYLVTTIIELNSPIHDKLGTFLLVSATFFIIYLLQYAIPFHLYKNQEPQRHMIYYVNCSLKDQTISAKALICHDPDDRLILVPEVCSHRKSCLQCARCTSYVHTWFMENRLEILPHSPLDPKS